MIRSVEAQAREYVYDLKNCASEFGYRTLEGWDISLVSDAEKVKIEKDYYPTISAHPAQESLFELLKLVKLKLMLPVVDAEYVKSTPSRIISHLIAFNPKMHR